MKTGLFGLFFLGFCVLAVLFDGLTMSQIVVGGVVVAGFGLAAVKCPDDEGVTDGSRKI